MIDVKAVCAGEIHLGEIYSADDEAWFRLIRAEAQSDAEGNTLVKLVGACISTGYVDCEVYDWTEMLSVRL